MLLVAETVGGSLWLAGWFPLGSLVRPDATVNVVARYPDHLDLFTVANDGRIMTIWWDARTGWAADWFHVQGGYAAPGSASTALSRSRIIWISSRSGPTTASTAFGGTHIPAGRVGSTLAAGLRRTARLTPIARVHDHLDLFTLGLDGRVWSAWWDAASGWASWFLLRVS